MSRNYSSREKHSFIQFYFDDWKAGTAHMTRLVRSIYFDICLYNWDKRKPVSGAALMMMTGDIDNAGAIIDALVEEGALATDDNGHVYSPRAIREGARAFEAWSAKSRGGKGRGKSEGGDNSGEPVGGTGTPVDEKPPKPAMLEESSEDSSKSGAIEPDSDSDTDSEEEEDTAFAPALGPQHIAEAWNEMARRNGLSQVAKITDERAKRLNARIKEHGAQAIIDGIKTIPDYPFLLGRGERAWKANFDWLLQPASCVKLLEGGYANGEGRPNGWTE